VPDESIARFKGAVTGAYAELERRRQEVNDLNVFPVADGDTGDNMAMTMRAVLDELERIDGQAVDDFGRDELVHAVARAALLGARGNSGVILSQIVRGAAEELVSRPGELVDPVLVSAALARAADAAYDSVRDPAEGTMLSAVRAMAHRVARDLAHMSQQRLAAGAPDSEQDELLAEVLERALAAGTEAVERGPDQLAVLREAGVVDAGAYGLTVIVAGVVAALRGEDAPELEHHGVGDAGRPLHQPQHESSRFRYCTNFAVTGAGLAPQSFVPRLEAIGDSVLVVGDDQTLRVHVHTDSPEDAVFLFQGSGEVSRFDVADMREQVAERTERLASGGAQAEVSTCGVVAVAGGAGLVRMFEDLGAVVVDGGAKLNPSTYEILAAIHEAGSREILVLPNSPNVVLAAERAAELSERPVLVVPTRAQQTGLAALVAFDPARSVADNVAAVAGAAEAVRTGGVARAARDDADGRFRSGDALGYVGEELVAWGDPDEVLERTFAEVAAGRELLTCIAGHSPPLDQSAVERAAPEGVELDYQDGGQPAWWWLVCAE
jgi:DAK2 domain fusion protein YloV